MRQTTYKIIFTILLCPLFAEAQSQKFQPVKVPLEADDRIVVRGYEGDVQIIPTPSQELRVEAQREKSQGVFDSWNFQVRKKKSQVEVIVKGRAEQEDWNKVRSGKRPSFRLKIFAPARPLELSWHKGVITAKDSVASITAQLTEGKFISENGKGTLSVQLINGSMSIKKHTGNLNLQSYKGSVSLSQTKGVLRVDNHTSRYTVNEHQGSAEINNYSGPVAIEAMEGALTLYNQSGVVSVLEHSGSIKGETSKGSLTAKAKRLQDFVVTSGSGLVNLKLPKDSGAFVRLRSEKGELQAYKYSNYLQKIRKGLWTELKGQLRGEGQGQVKIFSKYGNIVLR